MKNETKKAYIAPEVLDFGTLQEVVLNTCGTGSGDKGTVDVGDDSGWVADDLSYLEPIRITDIAPQWL